MTNKPCKAGNSRQKQNLGARKTKLVKKAKSVKLSEKKKRYEESEESVSLQNSFDESPCYDPQVEEDDAMSIMDPEYQWIQTSYWYRPEPEDKLAYKTEPTEYPRFPPNYFNLDVPYDGSVQWIELKDPNTVCPGSPGELPDKILAKKWFHDVIYDRYVGTPYKKMVRYAEMTSDMRIPVEEAKEKGLLEGKDKCFIHKVNWYGDIMYGKCPHARYKLQESDSIESDPSEEKPEDEQEDKVEEDPVEETEDITPPAEPEKVKPQDEPKTPQSAYVPLKYPIFPPTNFGTEEKDSHSWSMTNSSWGPTLSLDAPRPNEHNEGEPVILLKGSNTVLPGSPGQLPEYIPCSAWWREVRNPELSNGKFQNMLKYSELTWQDRVPIKPNRRKRPATPTQETVDWYNSYLYPDESR